jgi:hypothetical protein
VLARVLQAIGEPQQPFAIVVTRRVLALVLREQRAGLQIVGRSQCVGRALH